MCASGYDVTDHVSDDLVEKCLGMQRQGSYTKETSQRGAQDLATIQVLTEVIHSLSLVFFCLSFIFLLPPPSPPFTFTSEKEL